MTSTLDVTIAPGRPAILATGPATDAPHWLEQHRDPVREQLATHGALLVRGLGLRSAADVAAASRALAGPAMVEREAFAVRAPLAGGVYPATPWPAHQTMCAHHELSYAQEFPGLLAFGCLTAAAEGGATTLADAAGVLAALPADLVTRFEREGWLLVRTYHPEMGASYADAFGTPDRASVERYCRSHDIGFEWRPGGVLQTRQRRRAVVQHPRSRRRCWFNQVAFLSEWTLDPDVRDLLVDEYGPDALPFTTRFGDGDPIGADVVAAINAAYDGHTVRTPWQDGDLLLVDNLRTAHGREPYAGPREVVVALAEPMRQAALTDAGRGVS